MAAARNIFLAFGFMVITEVDMCSSVCRHIIYGTCMTHLFSLTRWSDKFNVGGICTGGNYVQKCITK
jgi:hypothetical protein